MTEIAVWENLSVEASKVISRIIALRDGPSMSRAEWDRHTELVSRVRAEAKEVVAEANKLPLNQRVHVARSAFRDGPEAQQLADLIRIENPLAITGLTFDVAWRVLDAGVNALADIRVFVTTNRQRFDTVTISFSVDEDR